jgi:biotin carboxyl carrier protein
VKRELTLLVDGEAITVNAERLGDTIVVERNGERHEIVVTGDRVVVPGAMKERPQAAGEERARQSPSPAAPTGTGETPRSTGAGEVHAPMVGVVREVHARQGARVASGDLIITMEAMKMDIYVNAPISGTVSALLCSPGETATEGAVLATITPPDEGSA